MRERLKAEGKPRTIEPKRILAKQLRPKPVVKLTRAPKKPAKPIDRISLLRERFMAFREKKQ